jgi:hypothetical protein
MLMAIIGTTLLLRQVYRNDRRMSAIAKGREREGGRTDQWMDETVRKVRTSRNLSISRRLIHKM